MVFLIIYGVLSVIGVIAKVTQGEADGYRERPRDRD